MEYQVIKSSNLVLLAIWFSAWFVVLLNGAATFGFWLPWPDPSSPGLLLMSLLFYSPPIVVVVREILERRSIEQPRMAASLSMASKALTVGTGLFALLVAGYAIATI